MPKKPIKEHNEKARKHEGLDLKLPLLDLKIVRKEILEVVTREQIMDACMMSEDTFNKPLA